MTLLLEGRVAWVTGGTRGLGRALCATFAREGADVAFNYTRADESAAETVAAIESHGRRAWPFRASVVDADALGALVKAVEASVGDGGGVDILVNNAGIGQVVPLALMEASDIDRMFEVHVKGAFLASQAVLRGMVRRKRGRILNIGSLAGVKMMEAPVHYSAAKAALRGFTESLAKEVGRYGITVNCLAPGVLETGVSDNLPKARLADYVKHCALGRIGTVQEAAEVAAFLVSDRNSYMSGSTIVVDGAV